jgi:hypothetical protein
MKNNYNIIYIDETSVSENIRPLGGYINDKKDFLISYTGKNEYLTMISAMSSNRFLAY